jgi:hypothetical protein
MRLRRILLWATAAIGGYAGHFALMSPSDAVGNAVSLGGSLILGVVLMLPGPGSVEGSRRATEGAHR